MSAEKHRQEEASLKLKGVEKDIEKAKKEVKAEQMKKEMAVELTRPYLHVDGLLHNKDGSKAFPETLGVVSGANLYAQQQRAFF